MKVGAVLLVALRLLLGLAAEDNASLVGPNLVIELPLPGTRVTSDLGVRLGINVAGWCNPSSLLVGPERCASLHDLVVCLHADDARQTCIPLADAIETGEGTTLTAHHLPLGLFTLTARLLWVAPRNGSISSSPIVLATSDGVDLIRSVESHPLGLPIGIVSLERSPSTTGLRFGLLRHGPFLFNIHDYPAGVSLEAQGEWGESVVRLLVSVLRAGDFAIDVGAHIGSFTVPLARRVGVEGRIAAFEPQLDLFQTLNANLALNGLVNVDAYRAAAGSGASAGSHRTIPVRDPSAGRANFGGLSLLKPWPPPTGSSEGGTRELGQQTTTFPVHALDDILESEGRCPRIIKVDVEVPNFVYRSLCLIVSILGAGSTEIQRQ